MSLKETVRLRLVAVRTGLDIPQIKFAKELGVGQSTLALWETGETPTSLDMIEKIAQLYAINTEWILGFSEDVFNNEVLNRAVADKVLKALENPISKRRGGKKKAATTSRRSGK